MAKQELKKPIDILFNKKNELEKRLTEIKDRYTLLEDQLGKIRKEQFGCKEAKERLPNTNEHKPAKRVLEQQIAAYQKEIQDKLKELDVCEKDRVVWSSQLKAMERSIRELQSA